jgi:hypothetical protein
LAETPAGAQANEFKFFCPLCMMYFREILETTCCTEYICGFCHAEFVVSQAKMKPGSAAGPAAGRLAAGAAGETALDERCIPKGLACPHCAAESAGKPMRQLRRGDVARSYTDSPQTQAAMAQRASAAMPPPKSPLRVGDDFTAMTRKLKWMDDGAECRDGGPATQAGEHDGMAQSSGRSLNQNFAGRLIMESVAESVDDAERLSRERMSHYAEKSQLILASEASEQLGEQVGARVIASPVIGVAAGNSSASDGVDAAEPSVGKLAMRIVATAVSTALATAMVESD